MFASADDYRRLLRMMKGRLDRDQVTIIAYCLLPTHFHLVLRQDGEVSLSRFVQGLLNGYVQGVNKSRGRRGPLLEGRFRAKTIGSDDHLLQACRYVHMNPVQAGLVAHPAEWPWSNYLEWIGARGGTLVSREVVEALITVYGEYRLP